MQRRTVLAAGAAGAGAALVGAPAHAAPRGDELCFMSGRTLARLLDRGEISAVELAQAHLNRIARRQPLVRAWASTRPEKALTAARASDARRRASRGKHGKPVHPLDGLPGGTKMLFDFLGGEPWDFGSLAFKDAGFVTPASSWWVAAMEEAGVVFLGAADTPEFGHKSTTGNLIRGAVNNPWDRRHNPGGSSGGSAAAAADHQGVLFIGSDAAGSGRTPASLTGIVGHYPTRGLIHQSVPTGPRPFVSPTPMGRSVWEVAHQLGLMSKPDPADPWGLPPLPAEWSDYAGAVQQAQERKPLAGKRIAYSPSFDGIFPVEPGVAEAVRKSLRVLEAAGAIVEEPTLGLGFNKLPLDDLGGLNPRIATRRDLSDLWVKTRQAALYGYARALLLHYGVPVDLRAKRDLLSPQFAAMLDHSARLGVEEYLHRDFLAAAIDAAFQAALGKYDFIVTPTTGVARVRNNNGGDTLGPTQVNGVEVDSQIGWTLTHLVNSSGVPATSVPCGFVANPDGGRNLPVGMQVIGRRFRDDSTLLVAAVMEAFQPWDSRYPRER